MAEEIGDPHPAAAPDAGKQQEGTGLLAALRSARQHMRHEEGCGLGLHEGKCYCSCGMLHADAEVQAAIEKLKSALPAQERTEPGFEAHARAVGDFLNELYAIMVDPCAEGTITVDELKAALVKAALRDREAENARQPFDYVKRLQDANRIVRESCLWKRFIDGTPLENDLAVWMTDFAAESVKAAPARAAEWQPLTTEEGK